MLKEHKQVSSIFRVFDKKNRAVVNFTDFVYVLDEVCVGLNFTKDLQMRMFGYLDRDRDGALHLKDFVRTIQEVQTGYFQHPP